VWWNEVLLRGFWREPSRKKVSGKMSEKIARNPCQVARKIKDIFFSIKISNKDQDIKYKNHRTGKSRYFLHYKKEPLGNGTCPTMSSTTDENKESGARNVSPDQRESTDKPRQKRVATVSRCTSRNQRQKRDNPVQIEAGREQESNGCVAETDPKEILKYVTSDLWSEDPAVVKQALANLEDLTCYEDISNCQENSKQILSLAGHMMIISALKKHMQDKDIVAHAFNTLQNILLHASDAYNDTHFSSILDALC
jgi:hypothetical protein